MAGSDAATESAAQALLERALRAKPHYIPVLDAYARPGVPEACLMLQDDYGQNTSLLLWAARNRPADAATQAQAAQTARAWDETTLVPLRAVRPCCTAMRTRCWRCTI